ncbi:hypothetical protein GGI26_004710, partial [Coemansia sp. RSA 1358]
MSGTKEESLGGSSRHKSSLDANGSVTPTREKYSVEDTHHDDIERFIKHEKLVDNGPIEISPLEHIKPVALFKLFRFSTKIDILLVLAGTFFSCASGVVTPVMIIIF